MRLYKDVKIELTLNMVVTLNEYYKNSAKIKKYNGQTSIVDIQDEISFSSYKQDIQKSNLDKVIVNCFDDETIIISNIESKEDIQKNTNIKATSRTEGILETLYSTKVSLILKLVTFGRLFIGNGSDFEDCFETKSGLKINDIVNKNYIINTIKNKVKNHNFDIEIDYYFNDDIRLLPNDDEFVEAVHNNRSEIMNAIEDDLSYKLYGNPLEE